jgi:hypothetical protein
MKKQGDIKAIKRLIEKCLDDGFHLEFFLPYEGLRNPSWNELREYALEAYAAALEDVLDAMEGNSDQLEEVASENGRVLVKYGDEDLFLEHLEELRDQLAAKIGDGEQES